MLSADLHTHSTVSHDGHSEIDHMCGAARKAGCAYICITDHFDFIRADEGTGFFDNEEYLRQLTVAKKNHAPAIRPLRGLEIGEIHRHQDRLYMLETIDTDMIIGSVHNFGEYFLGDPDLARKYGPDKIFDAYYREILAMVRCGGFDVIGHIDFPARYIKTQSDATGLIEQIIREALAKNIIIEINTSPLRKGMDFTMPGESILRMYRDCGGQHITVGSDAHRESDVAAGFDSAGKLVKKYGLTPVVFIEHRMRELR